MSWPTPKPVSERLASKYVVDESGCWLWTATRDARGYGKVSREGRMALAHRVSYELHVGPIPDGLTLDHLCRVRHCVNPAHLEPVAHAENVRRGAAVQTHCRKGHPFDEANTHIDKRGWRECRACHRLSTARRRALLDMARSAQKVAA